MASVGDRWAGLPATEVAARRRRGLKRWEARWRDGSGRSHKRAFAGRAEALAYATAHDGVGGGRGTSAPAPHDVGAALAADPAGGQALVRALLDDGLLNVQQALAVDLHSRRNLSPRGRESAAYHAARVAADLGGVPVRALTAEAVEDWLAGLRCAPSSRGKRLAALRSALRAVGVADPAPGLRVAASRTPVEVLSRDEVLRLADAILTASTSPTSAGREPHPAGLSLRALVLLLGVAGPRVSEAVGLLVRDLDPTRGVLRVRGTKTVAADRVLHLGPRLSGVLAEVAGDRPGTAPLLPNSAGRPLDRHRVNALVAEAGRRALGPHRRVTPHLLRHSAATAMLEAGVSLGVVAEVLGHASPAVTAAIYSHSTPAARAAALVAVDPRLREPWQDEVDRLTAAGVVPPWQFGWPAEGNEQGNGSAVFELPD